MILFSLRCPNRKGERGLASLTQHYLLGRETCSCHCLGAKLGIWVNGEHHIDRSPRHALEPVTSPLVAPIHHQMYYCCNSGEITCQHWKDWSYSIKANLDCIHVADMYAIHGLGEVVLQMWVWWSTWDLTIWTFQGRRWPGWLVTWWWLEAATGSGTQVSH